MDSNTNLSRSVLRIHGCHTSSLNTSIKSGMVLIRKICDLKLVFFFFGGVLLSWPTNGKTRQRYLYYKSLVITNTQSYNLVDRPL